MTTEEIRARRIRRQIGLPRFAKIIGSSVDEIKAFESGEVQWPEDLKAKAIHAVNRNEAWPDVTRSR